MVVVIHVFAVFFVAAGGGGGVAIVFIVAAVCRCCFSQSTYHYLFRGRRTEGPMIPKQAGG